MSNLFATETELATPAPLSILLVEHEEWPNDVNDWTFRKTVPEKPELMLSVAGTPILQNAQLKLLASSPLSFSMEAPREDVDSTAPYSPSVAPPAQACFSHYQRNTSLSLSTGSHHSAQFFADHQQYWPPDGGQNEHQPQLQPLQQQQQYQSYQTPKLHDPKAALSGWKTRGRFMSQSRYPSTRELIRKCFLHNEPNMPGTRVEKTSAQVRAWLDEHWPGCNAKTVRSQLSRHNAFERVKARGVWRLRQAFEDDE